MEKFKLFLKSDSFAKLITVLIYTIIALLIYNSIKFLLNKLAERKSSKQHQTALKIMRDGSKFLIIFFLIVASLTVYGIDVTKILAGLGVVSLVAGLALQDLLKDLIAGFSIILEDYFSIGDVITLNDFKGEVISLGIKSTKVKSYDGSILMINNREINKVINHSRENTLGIVNILVSNDEKASIVINVIEDALKHFELDNNYINKPECIGITKLSENYNEYRIIFLARPEEHYAAERNIRKLVSNHLIDAQIKMPTMRYDNERV